jgi:hypothetical protein
VLPVSTILWGPAGFFSLGTAAASPGSRETAIARQLEMVERMAPRSYRPPTLG